MSAIEIVLLARIDEIERRLAALEENRAQAVASLANVNAARREKRSEMLEAVTLIVQQYPNLSAKEIMKEMIEIGVDPPDLPRVRTVQRLIQEARQSLGAARDAEDFTPAPG